MENEIKINGQEYVLKSTIKSNAIVKKNLKGLTYCIIRTYSAGVFAGWIDRKVKGTDYTIFNSRRLWYWDGANSLSELAMKGVTKPTNCKFAITIPEFDVKGVIEIIPITEVAKNSISLVKDWVQ